MTFFGELNYLASLVSFLGFAAISMSDLHKVIHRLEKDVTALRKCCRSVRHLSCCYCDARDDFIFKLFFF